MTDDWDLLRQWAADGAQDAFAEIVNRHINLVYASARRRLRDDQAAEDVTQAVFLLLSQRARTLRRRESLPAWLFTAVRYAAANAMKMQRRRDYHEHLAAMERGTTATMENNSEITPTALDESIDKLPISDRTVLLLRFFQNKSLADVGAAMGIGESAAEKRVSRAVGLLRKILLQKEAHSQASLPALVAVAAEVAPSHLNATVVGTVLAGVNAGAKITLLASSAGRSMTRAAGGLLVGAVTILVLVIVAVSAFVAQRGRGASPPAPAKPVIAATQPDLIGQALPFDVVVKQSADDPAALLQQARDGIAAAEKKLQTLRTDSTYTVEKLNPSGQWTPAGEGDQTLWIENTSSGLMRDNVHKQVTEWINGAAPFYQRKFIAVYDGTVSRKLTIAAGPPQHVTASLEGRIDAGCLWPSWSPWGYTIYGVLNGLTSYPPLPKLWLSEALAVPWASARRVALNGRGCVEVSLLLRGEAQNFFVDPSHGWALVGYEWSVPHRVVDRFFVKELMPVGQGIEVPADVIGVTQFGQVTRYELHTTIAAANDPAWSEKLFQLDWPAGLSAVWDDRTHTVIRFPAKASPNTTQSNGERGL